MYIQNLKLQGIRRNYIDLPNHAVTPSSPQQRQTVSSVTVAVGHSPCLLLVAVGVVFGLGIPGCPEEYGLALI